MDPQFLDEISIFQSGLPFAFPEILIIVVAFIDWGLKNHIFGQISKVQNI
jgi:hypothetical protein